MQSKNKMKLSWSAGDLDIIVTATPTSCAYRCADIHRKLIKGPVINFKAPFITTRLTGYRSAFQKQFIIVDMFVRMLRQSIIANNHVAPLK